MALQRLTDAWAALNAPWTELLGSPVTGTEALGFVLAIAMVACNMRVNPWGWPLAIVSSALYAVVFWQSSLYGEATLQLVFIVLAAWGWRLWLKPAGEPDTRGVGQVTTSLALKGLALMLLGWPALGWLLARHTDSPAPYLDALPTVGSLLGQWWLARKLLENWGVWLAVNLVSIGLFASRGLWLTTALYAVFAVLSVAGWRQWRRSFLHPSSAHPA